MLSLSLLTATADDQEDIRTPNLIDTDGVIGVTLDGVDVTDNSTKANGPGTKVNIRWDNFFKQFDEKLQEEDDDGNKKYKITNLGGSNPKSSDDINVNDDDTLTITPEAKKAIVADAVGSEETDDNGNKTGKYKGRNIDLSADGKLQAYDTLVKEGKNIKVDNESYDFNDGIYERTFTVTLSDKLTGLTSVNTEELTVSKNATVKNNFEVQGDSTLNNLTVNGTTNLKNTNIDGDLAVTNKITGDTIDAKTVTADTGNITTVNATDVNTTNVTADNGDIKNLKSEKITANEGDIKNLKSEKVEVGNVKIENNQISGLSDATANDQAVTYGQFQEAIANVGGGSDELKRRVSGLEDRVDGLDSRINGVQKRADAGTAAAMAAAGLQSSIGPGRSVMSLSGATFHGQSGFAVGYSTMTDSGKIGIKAFGNGDSRGRFGAGASVGYHW